MKKVFIETLNEFASYSNNAINPSWDSIKVNSLFDDFQELVEYYENIALEQTPIEMRGNEQYVEDLYYKLSAPADMPCTIYYTGESEDILNGPNVTGSNYITHIEKIINQNGEEIVLPPNVIAEMNDTMFNHQMGLPEDPGYDSGDYDDYRYGDVPAKGLNHFNKHGMEVEW